MLLKVDQISRGSKAVEFAFKNSYGIMVSHRSSENCNSFIVDLGIGLDVGR